MDRNRGRGVSNRLGIFPTASPGVVSTGRVFLGLFLAAQRRIFGYILTLVANQADAEDVLQEVSLIMWEKFDEQSPPEDFAAWGCRIAFFRIQLFRRRRRRSRVLFSEAMLERVAETLAEGATSLQLDRRFEALDRCIEKLSRRDREILAERFREGATPHSTAESIGRSVDAVYKAMARIRKALHDCVGRTLAAEERS